MTPLPLLLVLAAAPALRERPVLPKPPHSRIDADRADPRQLVLKLHEGTRVRLRGSRLEADARSRDDEDRRRMKRAELTEERVSGDLLQLDEVLARYRTTTWRLFSRPEDVIDRERLELERQESEELADLNLYFAVVPKDAADAEAIADALNALASVELCYAAPLPAVPLAADIPPTTPFDLTPQQGYLRPASLGGIDADWAGRLPGGRGAGIRIIDVEFGWADQHEDIPNFFALDGWNYSHLDHGIAVMGVLGAGANSYGATGIVPDAQLGASSVVYPVWYLANSVAAAIDNAAVRLRRGDVMVIEQHHPATPPPGSMCTCNCAQFSFVPSETFQAEFDAIRNATARGIIVVEAAGNGSMNLDDAWWLQRFNRAFRDSRAILVGAGNAAGSLSGCRFSNFGSRVDLQGWGDSVATLGFGDQMPPPGLRANGADARQWYTAGFSGTSSATPIVAGAAAAVNGSRLADGLGLLDSFFMRQWLVSTGTPQAAPVTQNIGPRPNLRAALPSVVGNLETITGGVASGWAFQSNQPAAQLTVELEIDGSPVGSVVANVVGGPHLGTTGAHNFVFAIPWSYWDGQPHVLRATAQPVPASGMRARRLLHEPTFTLQSLLGGIGAVSADGRLTGWAFYAPALSTSIQVRVVVSTNDPFNPYPLGAFTANVPRPDVNSYFGVTGQHGFDIQLPQWLQDGTSHTVRIYAVNPVTGSDLSLGELAFTWYPTVAPWPIILLPPG